MTIKTYDPMQVPDAQTWLAMGERERIGLVLAFHHSIGDRGENEQMHCLLHVVVENQIAMGDKMPVGEKARQLMAQGLDRHQTLHAIATVLARHMYRLSRAVTREGDDEQAYFRELRRMSARKYLAMIS